MTCEVGHRGGQSRRSHHRLRGSLSSPSLYSSTPWALDIFPSTPEPFLLDPPGLPADGHTSSDVEIEGLGIFADLS